MIQCRNCGVETEENSNFCSLCGEPIADGTAGNQGFDKSGRIGREEKMLTDYQRLTGFQKRKIFWKISGLILISGIIITLLIDFTGNQNITWSKYPATINLVLFINITLNTFLHHKWILLAGISFLSFSMLFFLFDLYAGETGWKTELGITVLLVVYITIFSFIHLIRNSRQKGLNVIAWSLLATGILTVCTEAMISIYTYGKITAGWSLIVVVSAAMIASLLLYIHYRLGKATDLKRFFHI
jgi:hypothetical protein